MTALIFMLILLSINYSTYASNTLIIFLGCADVTILNDRISTTLAQINQIQADTKILFFSGGVKNSDSDDVSEASKTYSVFSTNIPYSNNWEFVLDEESTNTAENIIRAYQYVSEKNIDTIYISTSEFHYERAKLFAQLIFPANVDISWILSPYKTYDFVYWERIHIKNVHSDVNNALAKIN